MTPKPGLYNGDSSPPGPRSVTGATTVGPHGKETAIISVRGSGEGQRRGGRG